ncbi:cystatin-like fold lipoprotein [Staphylococcus caeli]|uniref:cystatin-like fold lipoprotein n=1 Tax=Staphylococcus caeli TaxID=2201815 RepID=UPI003F55E84F
MKKLVVLIALATLVIAGCSSGKYADKIDKAVKKQEKYQKNLAKEHKGDVERKFEKKNSNIYVYDKGKYVMIAYKPIKDDEEVHHYTYQFKDGKAQYIKDFKAKGYAQKHEPDYKEENMDIES